MVTPSAVVLKTEIVLKLCKGNAILFSKQRLKNGILKCDTRLFSSVAVFDLVKGGF